MEIRQLFAENVRRLRKANNLSQEQLAFETGIHRTYVSGVERSVRNPTLLIIAKFAKALEVEPDELLRPSGDISPQVRRSH